MPGAVRRDLRDTRILRRAPENVGAKTLHNASPQQPTMHDPDDSTLNKSSESSTAGEGARRNTRFDLALLDCGGIIGTLWPKHVRYFQKPTGRCSNVLVMRRHYLTALYSMIALTYLARAQKDTLILGILEDTPGHFYGDPNYRSVRVVFFKAGDNWKSFPNDCGDQKCLYSVAAQFPAAVKWSIAFNGRNVGQVTTAKTDQFDAYADIGQQKIRSPEPVPTIGKPSQEFAGFLSRSVLRPLVAISKPYFRDPEQWKPAPLPAETVKLVRNEFRKKFPKVSNCDNPEANNDKLWPYQDSNMKVVKAYSSNEGWSVVRFELERYHCDGPADDAFVDQWFTISPAQEVRFLDKAMWLVDAGDYDNDGNSELVFSIDDYDRGGYRMFYDHFRKEAVFEFSYH